MPGRIADEAVTHLVGLVGSSVRATLEIEAEIPGGTPDNVVRTVTENSRTLKFTSDSGFETEQEPKGVSPNHSSEELQKDSL